MTPRPLVLAALLASAPAFAGTPINETRPLPAGGQVSIDNLKGQVIVRAWDRPEVRITGTLGEGVEKLEIDADGDDLDIRVRYPSNNGGWFGGGDRSEPSTLEVSIPAAAALSVDTVSAGVDVTGVRGPRLVVDSVSGDVVVRAARVGEASFDNVSGSVDAQVESADIGVDSVSGDIRVQGGLGGRVRIDTVSGDAELELGPVGTLTLSSVSGDLGVAAGLAPGGNISADSVSGGIRVALPADASARIQVETFSGGISSPVGEVQTEKYGPGKSLQARLGQGDGLVRLESFSGNVRISVGAK